MNILLYYPPANISIIITNIFTIINGTKEKEQNEKVVNK